MRKNLYSILLVLMSAFISSCTKEEQEKELDFHYLPTKDVQWKFHFQGKQIQPATFDIDTSYHLYVTAAPNGRDTVINGNNAYWFLLVRDHIKSGTHLFTDSLWVLLGEDVNKKEIRLLNCNNVIYDRTTIDFNSLNEQDVRIDWRFQNLTAYEDTPILIGGVEVPRSSVNIPGKGVKFFKARGIGGPYGPFGKLDAASGTGGAVVSMEFIYKGQNHYFDYGLW
jgi:hypothetical protein